MRPRKEAGRARHGLAARTRSGWVAVALAAGVSVAACAPAQDPTAAHPLGNGPAGTVTVLGAASLTDVLQALAADFEAEHPGVSVRLVHGASSSLAAQVVAGAPVDVFAAASRETMATVVSAGLAAGSPRLVARNRLVLAVPAGNPGGISTLADLADPDRVVALCSPEVPCGAAAQRLLRSAGVSARPDTLERDVRAALTKVRLGEVDAALVYLTDVLAAGDAVEGIEVPGASAAGNDYLVAVLDDAPNPGAAAAFVDFLLAETGRRALGDAGFELP